MKKQKEMNNLTEEQVDNATKKVDHLVNVYNENNDSVIKLTTSGNLLAEEIGQGLQDGLLKKLNDIEALTDEYKTVNGDWYRIKISKDWSIEKYNLDNGLGRDRISYQAKPPTEKDIGNIAFNIDGGVLDSSNINSATEFYDVITNKFGERVTEEGDIIETGEYIKTTVGGYPAIRTVVEIIENNLPHKVLAYLIYRNDLKKSDIIARDKLIEDVEGIVIMVQQINDTAKFDEYLSIGRVLVDSLEFLK
mgnify:CR=1 FL=1